MKKTKYAIIASKEDKAAMNIREFLIADYSFKKCNKFRDEDVYQFENIKLYTIESGSIYSENIDQEIEEDIIIFASRHQSVKGVKSFSCHTPGNFGKAEYGGKDHNIAVCPAYLLKTAYLTMKKNMKADEVTLECTHHGPELNKPIIFMEIGSCETDWINKENGKIMAKTIIETIEKYEKNKDKIKWKVAIGIGGTHYCSKFLEQEDKDVAMSHICPKYQQENITKEMIKQMIDKTKEKVDIVFIDWKGTNNKEAITGFIEELGMKFERL